MAEETTTTDKKPITPDDIHMPPNSYWPIVLALGFAMIMAGLAFNVSLIIVGVITVLTAAIGWVIEPV